MAKSTAATFSVFSIFFLFTLFNVIDGVPFDFDVDDELFGESAMTLDTAVMIKSRQKRDIIESIRDTIMDILGYPFRLMSRIFASLLNLMASILMAPINYIRGLIEDSIEYILALILLLYQIITSPSSFLHPNNNNVAWDDSTNNASSPSTDNDQFQDLLGRLQESLRDWLLDMMWRSWDLLKSYILPRLDDFIVTLIETGSLSDNLSSILNSLHSAYQLLHMLTIL